MEVLKTHRAREEGQHLQCSGETPESQSLPLTYAGKYILPLTAS